MKEKSRIIAVVIVVAAGVALATYLMYGRSQRNDAVRVSGNVEVTDTEVSFKIPGRVEARLVDEGELVKAGQVVARLDAAELTREVGLRRAELEAARAVLAELRAGSRPEEIAQARAESEQADARLSELLAGSRPQEVAAAEAAYESAAAEAKRLEVDYHRAQGLVAKELISEQQFDAARTAFEVAKEREREAGEQLKLVREGPRQEVIAQARAAADQAREHYRLVQLGPRREQIDQARARVEQAEQALALAETRLGYATLTAPLGGVVLSKNVEAGEVVAAGTPVVTVGDLENVWVRAYINESDLGRVKVGQRARVTTDTYRGKSYEGRVGFVASEAEFTPKSVQTEKERVKLVYRVKVDIRNPNMELKPGMPADVAILLNDGGR